MKLKKLLCSIITVVMVLGTMSLPAFADDEFVEMTIDGETVQYNNSMEFLTALQNAANKTIDIKLVADVPEMPGYVPVAEGQTVTFDLNGFTLSTSLRTDNNTKHYYAIDNYGTFTLKDTSDSQTGKISARGIENLTGGVMVIESGTIESIDNNGGAAIWNEGDLTINGGTFKSTYVGTPSDQFGAGCLNNSGTALITAGTFDGASRRTYAIINTGEITIEDATVSGAHGALAVDAGTAVVNGGTYTSTDFYGLYVSNDGVQTDEEKAVVTVNEGEFDGKTTSVWIGSDVNTAVNSTIEINGGTFKKDINAQDNTRSNAVEINDGTFEGKIIANAATTNNIVINNGTFNEVISENVVVNGGTFTNPAVYSVAITIDFVENADDTEGRTYDIMVKATDGKIINRLTSAELKFAIKQLADDTGKTGKVSYTIVGADHVNIIPAENGVYEFNLDGIKDVADKTGNEIKIGEVVFSGYGKFAFAAISDSNNKIHATRVADNIVSAYTANGAEGGTLMVNPATTGEGIDETQDASSVITDTLAPATQRLNINVTFPNAVESNVAAYQQMKVTISGGDLPEPIVYELGENMEADGSYVVTEELSELTAYTVTVSGEGYRTVRYTVNMGEEDKTLTFWNNVKDEATVIETGKDASKANVTFLAGDIVRDGEINLYDLSAVVSYFGMIDLSENEDNYKYAKYDLNRDGKIDSKDVAMVLVSWGN